MGPNIFSKKTLSHSFCWEYFSLSGCNNLTNSNAFNKTSPTTKVVTFSNSNDKFKLSVLSWKCCWDLLVTIVVSVLN